MLRTTGVLLALLLVAACTSPEPSGTEPPAYVALGDSFTAGPAISPPDLTSGGCLRSAANYPSLLADERDLDLTDMSCGGTSTTEVLQDTGNVPAQVSAVDAETDLVTIGIGGNDGGFAAQLIAACMTSTRPETTCPDFTAQLPARLPQIEGAVGVVVDQVLQAAPDADVVLVGYLPLVGDAPCEAALPLSQASIDGIAESMSGLERTLGEVAEAKGVPFASMMEEGADHHPCSDDPWVNGIVPTDDGSPAHPRKAGMEATARVIGQILDES